MDRRPIGMFDSGVGGISVLREAVRQLPRETFIYFGDSLNAPYGDRAEDEILSLCKAAAARLMAQDIKALLIACNTATAASAHVLRAELPIPVVGMEPALKPASQMRHGGKVVVLATAATLALEKFHILMQKYGTDAEPVACPELMRFVERGETDSPALDAYLQAVFAPYRGQQIDAVVLGCTHYPFLRKAIARAAGQNAVLVDGNLGTVRQLRAVLTARDALSDASQGAVRLSSSLPGEQVITFMHSLLTLED